MDTTLFLAYEKENNPSYILKGFVLITNFKIYTNAMAYFKKTYVEALIRKLGTL